MPENSENMQTFGVGAGGLGGVDADFVTSFRAISRRSLLEKGDLLFWVKNHADSDFSDAS